MTRHHRRRRLSRVGRLTNRVFGAWGALTAHPVRAAVVGVLSCAALWVVVTKSLPYALAPSQPDTALALNPGNPAALIAQAEDLKKQLVALISVEF